MPLASDVAITIGSAGIGRALALGVALMVPAASVHAAELTLLAGGSLTSVMADVVPPFERATGHKLTIKYAGTPELIRLANSGDAFDLGVVPVDVMQNTDARAKFGETTNIARGGFGVAVKAGAPKPDISTVEAMKQTLLNAKSVTFYPESASGAYLMKMFDRLGITEQMKPKIKAQATPAQIPVAVANGDAELGLFLTYVLVGPGIEMAGLFPPGLQQDLVFTGAVATGSKAPDAAKAFLSYLQTPEATAMIKARGMTPG